MSYQTQEFQEEVDDTTAQTAPTEETNDDSKLSEESKHESEVDYAAELEKEQALRKELEENLTRAETKIVELKKGSKESKEVDPDELVEKVWKGLESKLSEQTEKDREAEYEKHIRAVSSNESEAKLIKFHLENGLRRTGNIEVDVENAKLLANKQKIIRTNKELAEALKSRSTLGSADYASHKAPVEEGPQFSARERALLERVANRYNVDKKKLNRN